VVHAPFNGFCGLGRYPQYRIGGRDTGPSIYEAEARDIDGYVQGSRSTTPITDIAYTSVNVVG
jgi:hypothetical protein